MVEGGAGEEAVLLPVVGVPASSIALRLGWSIDVGPGV
jgi:hypothetical protein